MLTLISKGLLYVFLLGVVSNFIFVLITIFKIPTRYRKTPFFKMISKAFIRDLEIGPDKRSLILVKNCFLLTASLNTLIGVYTLSCYLYVKYLLANP